MKHVAWLETTICKRLLNAVNKIDSRLERMETEKEEMSNEKQLLLELIWKGSTSLSFESSYDDDGEYITIQD
jgi:hypothetical protein